MISLLTPTGGRPEAFSACVEMMRAQDYTGPVRWVIVDDCIPAMPVPEIDGWEVLHVKPKPLWRPGQNTLARNLLAGLEWASDRVVVIEDDDVYEPWWLRSCDDRLVTHDLIGESHSLYVHRDTGRKTEMSNDRHASLCSTALKGAAVGHLRRVCETGHDAIDMRLWRSFRGSKKLYRPEPRGVTGLKGWPGRAGIGVGHRMR